MDWRSIGELINDELSDEATNSVTKWLIKGRIDKLVDEPGQVRQYWRTFSGGLTKYWRTNWRIDELSDELTNYNWRIDELSEELTNSVTKWSMKGRIDKLADEPGQVRQYWRTFSGGLTKYWRTHWRIDELSDELTN